jgi:hypothetical protein
MLMPVSYPTPVRRTRRKSVLRRIVQDVETGKPKLRQRGYVYQKGKKKGDEWNPTERAYGRYRIDVPRVHKQKEVRIALGYCRDELDAVLKLQEEMTKAGVRDLEKVRERISPTASFREQAAWWIAEMSAGRIVNTKKREVIDPNTINAYQNAVAYLNDQIGDMPLALIDNPQAKTLIIKMKSELRDDRQRRFSDKTIFEYFRVLRRVIASVLDENFNSIHHRSWNLAAIGLPRVNPKKQRRPTLTAKEMTTLLSKAEGQYQVFYFFCLVTGMRVSEAVAVEIDKHVESDAATWTSILTLQQSCVTSSAVERVAFSFNRRTEPCSIHGISRGIVLRTFSKRWAVAKRGRSSMFSGASVKSCCNEAMHGKS